MGKHFVECLKVKLFIPDDMSTFKTLQDGLPVGWSWFSTSISMNTKGRQNELIVGFGIVMAGRFKQLYLLQMVRLWHQGP
jgi:hypothetical protein